MEIGYNSEYRREGSSYQNSSSHIRLVFGATVSWLLYLIGNCFGFAFLRSMIGQKKSRHFINQSNLKLNPVASCLTAFSRAAGCWLIFTLISHWLLNQSNSKLKPAASWLTAFSRAAGSWLIFYSDFSLTPQPIKLKTKTNRVFVERVFPRFTQLTCVYFDFSLVPQPIKFKTKTSRVLVDHVFPRFRQLTYFYFDFSLAPSDVSLLWLVVQIFLVYILRHSMDMRSI